MPSFVTKFALSALGTALAKEYLANTVGVYSEVAATYARYINRENIAERELMRVFRSGDFGKEISDIVVEGSKKNDTIISQVFREGGNAGYTAMRVDSLFGASFREGFKYLQEYNSFLLSETTSDLGGAIMGRVASGFAADEHPFSIARDILSSGVDLPAKAGFTSRQRAFMIARTETARAWTQGAAQSYANMGVTLYNHVTAGDDDVCGDCISLEEGNPHSLQDIFIPVHPNCRCAMAPVVPDNLEFNDNGEVINLTPVEMDFPDFDSEWE